MRFDDSLDTVLSADMESGFGAQAAWRQLVDLVGRGRAPADASLLARLRLLRQAVPVEVRAASARALAFAAPASALVGFFAEDVLSIAAPILRTATLPADDWLALLPRLSPATRSVLRHRRDLPDAVMRGLESFGAVDFVLPYEAGDGVVPAAAAPPPPPASPLPPDPATPLSETPFVALGEVARGLPMVAEALRRHEEPPVVPAAEPERFEIADLVARIDEFQRTRPEVADRAPPPAETFRFGTDERGTIRWVDGVVRGPLVGVDIALAAPQGVVAVDAVMAGALRQRARFVDARLEVGGESDAAGAWRVAGEPRFDAASGRFTGYRAIARRPRPDEAPRGAPAPVADSLRQLVHELRTPTNAIAGFAELIEAQLLGPVDPAYRRHATAIREQAAGLIGAIDDLDTAARIEGRALELRPAPLPLAPLLARIGTDLEPLAALRGARLLLGELTAASPVALIDDRAAERLFGRLLSALVAAAAPGEIIAVAARPASAGEVALGFSRPRALVDDDGGGLLSLDADGPDAPGAPLLGTGFALRLARRLAVELGGELAIGGHGLTLRLPAAVDRSMEQATH